ncbi:methionine adenosyltransferase [Halothece sp. PCC 7418]|uniref:methionine adenosyltransferase n=1 Tax=Halothece sp. (strain PCC 7418) TaxID=65093 RepID=UPI0002A074F5|nr:methionine adenosyltransferase [Halothece sp. PCC 7418]AFZ45151.1 methionine adenosyltransferase [Halothece sp. PCC 7418]
MKKDFMFTSESVTAGHPDKLCDQISDAILDRCLQQNPKSRAIVESAVSAAILFLAARFDADLSIDFTTIAREVIDSVGYHRTSFSGKNCSILSSLDEMSPENNFDESQLSDAEIEQITARDQATVFGFACDQTPVLMPIPIWLAHQLARRLHEVQLQNILPYLSPDGKTLVGVEYQNREPKRIHSITILASQNDPAAASLKQLRDDIRQTVVEPVFAEQTIQPDRDTRIYINPEGLLSPGGPEVHAGLTGRKNAIDTYGEYAKHSGAALSGKDPTRIDRVGAYAARYAAKNVVAANLARECEVQLSYSLGLSRPVSIQVETFATGKISEEEIARRLEQHFEFRLAGIIKQLQLRSRPSLSEDGFFRKLAAYGHVGRSDLDLPWEMTDRVDCLQD